MKNTPNRWRVHYQVMEGNNYAGGWGRRIADVFFLSEVREFSNVIAVYPAYVEVSTEPVAQEDIDRAITEYNENEKGKALLRDDAEAEEQLNRARKAMENNS